MAKRIIIAIDGPAGAGKSSCAKLVAQRLNSIRSDLNIEYVDSGAIYRGITKKLLDSKIKIENYIGIKNLLEKIKIELKDGRVLIDGNDVTEYLRTKEVTELVSPVSNNIDIRKRVNLFLNEYAKNKSIIMDGRDIGTVVFPDATFKFYLDASVDVRAERRYKEKHTDMTLDEIKESIIKRDENDKNKPFGALKIADDAIYIDTSFLTLEEVVQKILDIIIESGV
ncbi:MAG TPA: (d)CMP kinase [Spirochaetota bacterium]|nr:(d)CMP kinase [Spirochaetota bacterium]HOL56754.1 (d)CMP kinase [Spirochaetota bacterium]HPP04186.1 (d)CMP kinase [Spirochaetota bacterium]